MLISCATLSRKRFIEGNEEGFSLPELLITLLIMGILLGMVITVFVGFTDASSATSKYLRVEDSVNNALNLLSSELREASVPPNAPGTNVLQPLTCVSQSLPSSCSSATSTMQNTIVFYIPRPGGNYQAVRWQFIQNSQNPNLSILESDFGTLSGQVFTVTGSNAVLNYVQNVTFCYLDKAGDDMINDPRCPGAQPTSTSVYNSSNVIVTCVVAVVVEISTYAPPGSGIGSINTAIGASLKNQVVTEGGFTAVLPTGYDQTC